MAKWEERVNDELKRQGGKRKNGKTASVRTQNITKTVVYAAFRRLHELGYRIEEPKNVSDKHIRVLVNDWWYTQKHNAKTLQNDISRLRVFFALSGRGELVKQSHYYLPDVDPEKLKVKSVAEESKSWSSTGVDMREIFEKVDRYDERLGLMLRMELAFGLRREEVLKCMPHVQDDVTSFAVLPGQGKGGRSRTITTHERQILEYVKKRVGPNEALGWPVNKQGKTASLKQNLSRYSNAMRALGFTKKQFGRTGHGLRAQFSENIALALGLLPPTLGGLGSQLPKDQMRLRKAKIAEALGHHRPEIVAAYFSAFGREVYKEGDEQIFFHIEEAVKILERQELANLVESRRNDCITIRNAMETLGTDMNLRQVQALWSVVCNREGLEWKEPKMQIALFLEGAAMTVILNDRNKTDKDR